MANIGQNTIVIADKELKTRTKITDEVRRAEQFIAQKFEELKSADPAKYEKKKKSGNRNIETEVILLLINITSEYLEERDKIEELKKDMTIKIDSLINRVELLL